NWPIISRSAIWLRSVRDFFDFSSLRPPGVNQMLQVLPSRTIYPISLHEFPNTHYNVEGFAAPSLTSWGDPLARSGYRGYDYWRLGLHPRACHWTCLQWRNCHANQLRRDSPTTTDFLDGQPSRSGLSSDCISFGVDAGRAAGSGGLLSLSRLSNSRCYTR